MRLLALDTSSWWGSVALAEGEGASAAVVAEAGGVVERTHARSLMPWIDGALAQAGWSRSQLDLLAAVHGPGSFTGLRIGLGTLQGLAFALDRPALGISGLEAIAFAAGDGALPRLAWVDAGREEVYTAAYDAAGQPQPGRLEPAVHDPAAALSRLDGPHRVLVRPPLAEQLDRWKAIDRADSGHVWELSETALAPAAARLALRRDGLPRGGAEASDLASLRPLYLRPADARIA